ncbi:hypothetical protein ACS82_00150 [Vibrio parahaemolyticus]|nr:hypothetical protein ACS82_00150 [Vibrio parahaemolyticus]
MKRQDVIAGSSLLGEEGKVFFEFLQMNHGLYDNSLWLFLNTPFSSQEDSFNYSECFRLVGEALFHFKISSPGLIVRNSTTGDITTKQPPNINQRSESCRIENVSEPDLKRLIRLTAALQGLEHDQQKYFKSILDYLRDIRNSPLFVAELALWSFLEHHWTPGKNGKSDIRKSLKCLLEFVCVDRNEKNDFNKLVTSVGSELGSSYNEHLLRNILAHGKHFTLKEKWSNENWANFHKVHEQLLELVTRGIEKQVFGT